MSKKKLIFVDSLPVNGSGKYIDYQNRKNFGSQWEPCDMRSYIAQKQDVWFEDIEHWHSHLSAIASKLSKWWWFMPASRLIADYPPVFKCFLFAVAVVECCRSYHNEKIYLVGCPRDVYEYIKELTQEYDVSTEGKFLGSNTRMPSMILGSIKTFVYLVKLFFVILLSPKQKKDPENIKLVIFSHFLNIDTFIEKGDHYFGKIFEDFKNKESILWIYLGYPLSDLDKFTRHMEQGSRKWIFLYQLLGLKDLLKIVWLCLKLLFDMRSIRKKAPGISVSGYKSDILIKSFFDQDIYSVVPFVELACYFAMINLFKKVQPKGLIYPYEEKGVERAILQACKTGSLKTKTMGFAHAVYNKGHMYLRNRESNPLKPDILFASGEAMKEWFVNWAKIEGSKIKILGSPRYHEHLLVREDFGSKDKKLKVLVLIGIGHELGVLASYLEERKDLFDGCELLIRKYPYSWQAEQDDGLLRLKRIYADVHVDSRSLSDQIFWADVVIYNSTSAGIEAMLKGRLTICLELQDVFVSDCTLGKPNVEKIYRCKTANELSKILDHIKHLNTAQYFSEVEKQDVFACNIYSPVNNGFLKEMVENKNPDLAQIRKK